MTTKIVHFINFPMPTPNGIILPYAWLAFKSWFEDNSRKSSVWYWPEPLVTDDFESVEEIIAEIEVSGTPDVLCFSNYSWNFKLQDEIAKAAKAKWPNTFIFYGGPQQTAKHDNLYFKHNPHVTAVCAEGGYGEPVLTELLDQIAEDRLDLSKVPFIRYAGPGGLTVLSTVEINKRGFTWVPILRRHKDYLTTLIKKFKDSNTNAQVVMLYEGSRGCPYGCVFCEWGLNTSSKVNFKPYEMVIDDISVIPEVEVDYWHFVDANWGSRKEDVDIVKALIKRKQNTDYPAFIDFFAAKNNKKNVIQAQEALLEAGMHLDTILSVQDQDDGVKKAIDRIDLNWDSLVELYTPIIKKYKTKVSIDLIIGLPGSTIDTHYAGYNKTLKFKRAVHPAWLNDLLLVSPANEPSYKEKYQIETVTHENLFNTISWRVGSIIIFREEEISNIVPNHLTLNPKYQNTISNVVACSTFSRDDYVEMYMTDRMTYVLDGNDSMFGITRYLWKHLAVEPSIFVKALWREFFNSPEYLPHIFPILDFCVKEFRSRIEQPQVKNLEFFQWPGDPKIYFRIDTLFWLAVLINPQAFYNALLIFLKQRNWLNSELEDLISFTSQMVKTCDYDPIEGKVVEAKYDWLTWLTDTSSTPNAGHQTIEVSDSVFGPVDTPISWVNAHPKKQLAIAMFEIANPVPYTIFFTSIHCDKY